MYEPLINRYSVIDGVLDDDCKQYIMEQIVHKLPKFRGLGLE